jgi:Ca-activated chloride channel family protein
MMGSFVYKFLWVVLVVGVSAPSSVYAEEFRFLDLWLTRDQQGQYYFDRGEFEKAADLFEDPFRKATSEYRAGDYEAAARYYALVKTAEGYLGSGNAQAHLGNFEAARNAYMRALKLRPDFEDAAFNRELMDLLIEQAAQEEDDEQNEEAGDPSFDPDEVKFDEKGKLGKEGQVEQAELSDEQMAEMLLRHASTSPAQFLRSKFSFQWQSQAETEDSEKETD